MFLLKRGKVLFFSLLIAAGLFLISTSARAYPVTFHFEGNVGWVNSALSGIFDSTQTLSGYYTFQSDAADTNPITDAGIYPYDTLEGTISGSGGDVYTFTSHGGSIKVLNNPSNYDYYGPDTGLGNGSPSISGNDFELFYFVLYDNTDKNGLTSEALPLTPPNISDFDAAYWTLTLLDSNDEGHAISGGITSLYSNTDQLPGTPPTHGVPEPSTLLLLGTGLVGLAMRGKKTR